MNLLKICLIFMTCFKNVYSWHVNQGIIYDDKGKQFNLSGLSWFGFETQDFVVNGLWSHPMDFYMDLIKNNGINTLRIPFSAEWIHYNFDLYPYDGLVASDPQNQHKKSIEILDELFEQAEKRNIKIMLDLHRLHKEYISELWYSPTDKMFTSDTFFETWFKVLDRYKDKQNLIAIDLLNEPHGSATWGNFNQATDWNHFVEYAIPKFEKRYPNNKWLYLVEGIGWGKDLSQVQYYPINVPKSVKGRLVYSAHSYGKSVVSSTDVYNKYQLYHDWDNAFGYLAHDGYTYIIGEYGGITNIDAPWMETFSNYLIENNMRNNFFWSLGPNSGDVQGLLLDDWTTIDGFKLSIIHKLIPYPTF